MLAALTLSLCPAFALRADPHLPQQAPPAAVQRRRPKLSGVGLRVWGGLGFLAWYASSIAMTDKGVDLGREFLAPSLLGSSAVWGGGWAMKGRQSGFGGGSAKSNETAHALAWAGAGVIALGSVGVMSAQLAASSPALSGRESFAIRQAGWFLGGPLVFAGSGMLGCGASHLRAVRRHEIRVSGSVSKVSAGVLIRCRF